MRKPLIDADNNVVNVIEIEDGADYTPPDGLTMLGEHPDAVIGGKYDRVNKTFVQPIRVPEPEPILSEVEQKAALYDQLVASGVVEQAVSFGKLDSAAVTAVANDVTIQQ